MSILLFLVFLAAFACDRVKWLKSRPWLIGIIFGVLAIAADPLFLFLKDWGGLVRDAPPIAAALYFGPVAGIVAGAIAATWSNIFPSQAAAVVNLWLCPFATLITACYAAAVGRWFFDSKRPALVPAMVVVAFGEVAHLAVDAFSNTASMSLIVGIGYAAVRDEVIAYIVLTALVAFACRAGLGWRENFKSGMTIAMVVFTIGFSAFTWYEIRQAFAKVNAAVEDAQRRLDHDIDDQLGLVMHVAADSFLDSVKTAHAESVERMQEHADYHGVDVISVVGTDGVALASNYKTVLGWDFKSVPETAEFMTLTNSSVSFVKQRFRRSVSNPELEAKYIGVRFPDGSGFVQFGYMRNRMEKRFDKFFIPMLVDMSVGKSGYYVVANTNGVIAADAAGHSGICGKKLDDENIGLVRPSDGDQDPSGNFTAKVFGHVSRCRCIDIGDWRVYCVVPFVDEFDSAIIAIFFVGVLLLTVCMAFQVVGQRFRQAREKIDMLRANEDARRLKDMGLAQTIQHSALPSRFPEEDDFRIFARMDAAKEVGGDFYDFFTLPSGELVFLIADVSGKSVPGAMFMMQAKMALRSCFFTDGSDILAAVTDANQRLCENNLAEMFVTVWVGMYNRKTQTVRFVSAGHNPPLVKRADGSVEWVRAKPKPPLAVIDGAKYVIDTLTLHPGDTLLLYTDGVTEAVDVKHGFYGEKRLEAAVAAAGPELVSAIRADVAAFSAGAEQADDITMLALDVK